MVVLHTCKHPKTNAFKIRPQRKCQILQQNARLVHSEADSGPSCHTPTSPVHWPSLLSVIRASVPILWTCELKPQYLGSIQASTRPWCSLSLESVSGTDMYNSRHVAEENMEEKTNLYNNHILKKSVQSIAIAPSYLKMHDKCWD